MDAEPPANPAIARAARFVVIANLAYFGIEFAVARAIGSVSLFADSVDFLEDASVNLLILVGLRWSMAARGRLGLGLAGLLLVPTLATLWTAWTKISAPIAPTPLPLLLAGGGALIVNTTCALVLARIRNQGGSLTRAAFLSSRNDAIVNIAIIIAALVTFVVPSPWPDLVVGIAIALLNAGAAREVFMAAHSEMKAIG